MSIVRPTTPPKFSIVIPTYNAPFLLKHCLQSLSNQSIDKRMYEVIVINDGGDKQISKIVTPFTNFLPLRYIYQENKGPAVARNFGIDNAKGEIILFLDDDSLPTSNWFEAVLNAWHKYPDSDGIGGYILCNHADNIYCRVNTDLFNWYLREHLSGDSANFLVTCNAGYKREILTKAGKFDEKLKMAAGEDRDLNIKIMAAGGKLRLDDTILVYHDRDLTLKSFAKKYYNYGIAAYKIYSRYESVKYMRMRSYSNLYFSILPKYKKLRGKILAFFLITLSQIFSVIGYTTSRLANDSKNQKS